MPKTSNFNPQSPTNPQNPSFKKPHTFDLEARTLKFGKNIVNFCAKLPQTNVFKPIIDQLIRSGTSLGANYYEATEASSRRDFLNKIAIAKKEAKETQYWLRLLAELLPLKITDIKTLSKEAQELNLIFAAIIRNSNSKPKFDN